MSDFITSIDGLAAITSVVALIFTIVTLFLEKRIIVSHTKQKDAMTLRINGKKVEVSGEEKETLSKVLGVTGGEYIFIERIEMESDSKQD